MNEFDACQLYMALKLHFTTKYDYFKYNGKTKLTVPQFNKRKDKYQFVRLARKYSYEEFVEYCCANLIRGKQWIGDFSKDNLLEHQKVIQSLEYNYKNDLEKLLTNCEKFDILFECGQGSHPRLLKQYLGKKISLETMVILDKILGYKTHWDKAISETYIWPDISKRLDKYSPFVNIDVRKYRQITLTNVKDFT
tara:strand:- start:418 stop:999 length:582 start_codon:yes stop_codon:yes gene_type:complete